MEYSAQRVRAKTRAAVKRREDQVEQEETESGELNLIPYLDMVTNLMLFLLASISAGIILVQIDTQLPDKRPDAPITQQPPTPPKPDEQPLGMVVSIYPTKIEVWSASTLEGTLQQPKATFPLSGNNGDACDGPYMCQSNKCDADSAKCVQGDSLQPVFDYRALNRALLEITTRRYAGKVRKIDLYTGTLQADGSVPYSTIVGVIAAMRCPLPAFGKEPETCMLPSDAEGLKKAADPIAVDKKFFDPDRAVYDPKTMSVFSDILFSTGLE